MSTFVVTAGRRAGARLVRLATLVTAAAVLTGTALTVSTVSTAAPAQAASGARSVGSSFDAQVLRWTNVERTKRGLRPLRAATCSQRFATAHTKRMAARNRLFHQPMRPVMRACQGRTAGENVAYGGRSLGARQVVRMWMGSRGHRANILAKKYRHLAVDAWRSPGGRVYVGQVFGG